MYKGDWKLQEIQFANRAVEIAYYGVRASKIIEFMSRHIFVKCAAAPHIRFTLMEDALGRLELRCGEVLIYQGDEEAVAAEYLIGSVGYHLADKSESGLLCHAAAVAWDGRGIMLPGISGRGKSTLTAWLLTQKFSYLTDEFVFMPDCITLEPFVRPLNLKSTSRPILEPLISASSVHEVLRASTVDLIQPTMFGQVTTGATVPLHFIILPQYVAGSPFIWERLSVAQGGFMLMQCVINARNLPRHGFDRVTELARTIPIYRMCYSHFAQMEKTLSALCHSLETG